MTFNDRVTSVERFFADDDIIVSKTNLKGTITYANRTFLKISGYTESEVLGRPHNIIRHQDMPRCIFKMLWDRLLQGHEMFAYVMNRCKNGDHYWVFAHVTPSFDGARRIVGYHSNRRVPNRAALDGTIIPLYRTLLDAEHRSAEPKAGMLAAYDRLCTILEQNGATYDQFIFSL